MMDSVGRCGRVHEVLVQQLHQVVGEHQATTNHFTFMNDLYSAIAMHDDGHAVDVDVADRCDEDRALPVTNVECGRVVDRMVRATAKVHGRGWVTAVL